MIRTIFRIAWINLRRDRVALALTFVLPLVFFSIFAGVFGGQANDGTPRVRVAVVDEDHSDASRRLIEALTADPGLRVTSTSGDGAADGEADGDDDAHKTKPLDRASALALVRAGDLPVAVVLPRGFGEHFGFFGGEGHPVELLADKSDPVAPQVVLGLLQKAAMTAAPDLLARGGIRRFEQFAGPLTPQQSDAVGKWFGELEQPAPKPKPSTDPNTGGMSAGLVNVHVVDVLGEDKNRSGVIAFYAAGTGVMFLLFSMAGASGTLLEDQESGTLERLLVSNVGMGRLLVGKWLFIAALGVVQVALMFLWGAIAFGIELREHLGGFAVMTIVTAAAAAAFGLVLATASRTRAQLSGISTIVILVMSAVGGSMFPRFLMPELMQKLGLATFNAWALDGYQKVFWYEQPTRTLWPQVAVLIALTMVFLGLARVLARRWEMS